MENSQKCAIVTGGSRGIGKATALASARKGVHVVIADVLDQEGVSVARDIQQKQDYRNQKCILWQPIK